MDSSQHHQQQDDPIHLANLVSTEPGINPANNNTNSNKIQAIDSYSNEKNLDLNNDRQFLQPQPQQQQQQQYPIQPSLAITDASHDALDMTMNEKEITLTTIQPPDAVAAPRMKLANLVDKVRVHQILQKSQPELLAKETNANTSLMLSPLSTNTLDSHPESRHGK